MANDNHQSQLTKPITIATIAIASGGTGGHIWPSFSLMDDWQRKGLDIKVIWISSHQPHQKAQDTLSFKLAQRLGCEYISFQSYAFRSASLWSKFLLTFRLINHIFKIRKTLKDHRVDWVVGFGSYASFTAVVAGKIAGCFTAIHEQNAKAGLANRTLLKLVDVGFEGFEGALKRVQPKGSRASIHFTGNPLRPIKPKASQSSATKAKDRTMKVLVLGGSQGASFLNQTIPPLLIKLAQLPQNKTGGTLSVIHQSGQKDLKSTRLLYDKSTHPHFAKVVGFIDDIPQTLQGVDWVISRSGAMSVGELMQFQKPCVLIPYPFASDNHQYANACVMQSNCPEGAVLVLEQMSFTPLAFEKAVHQIIENLHTFKAGDWPQVRPSCEQITQSLLSRLDA